MLKDEKKIILMLKQKSEAAFNIIYKEYFRLIYYIIYQMVNDVEVSNDLTSDTFIKMYQKINQHDENKSFKYWLITIAKNNAREYLRKVAKENTITDDELVLSSADKSGNIDGLLAECKMILTPIEYDVINYKIVFDMTFVEIGALCNVSKSEAHRIYQRAIKKLRAEM